MTDVNAGVGLIMYKYVPCYHCDHSDMATWPLCIFAGALLELFSLSLCADLVFEFLCVNKVFASNN